MRKRRQVGTFVIAMLVGATAFSGLSTAAAATKPKTPTPLKATKSFEFTLDLSVSGSGSGAGSSIGLETTGVYKAPGSQDCTAEASLGALKISQRMVVVGKKAWIDEGNGFQPAKTNDFEFTGLCPSDPSFWADFGGTVPASLTGTPETVNGIATEKLDLGAALDELAGFGPFGGDIPDDVTIDTLQAWRATKGGYVAALDAALTATTDATCAEVIGDAVPLPLKAPCKFVVSYKLSNVDSKDLKITAPKTKKK